VNGNWGKMGGFGVFATPGCPGWLYRPLKGGEPAPGLIRARLAEARMAKAGGGQSRSDSSATPTLKLHDRMTPMAHRRTLTAADN